MRVIGGVRKEGERWTSTCHVYYDDGTTQTWVARGHPSEKVARETVQLVIRDLQIALGGAFTTDGVEQEYAN